MTSFETQLVNARDTGREVKMRIDELGPDAEPAGPEELDVDVNDEVEVERMIDDPTRVPLPVAAVAVQDPSRSRIRTKRYRVRMVILNIDTGEESTLACARIIKLAFLQVGQNQTFPRLLTLTFLFPPPPSRPAPVLWSVPQHGVSLRYPAQLGHRTSRLSRRTRSPPPLTLDSFE